MQSGTAASLMFAVLCLSLRCQTTQGVIAGRIFDQQSKQPVAGAQVTAYRLEETFSGAAASDRNGYYTLALLPPGRYRVRAERDGYQPQETYDQELAVAGRLEITFELRPAKDLFGTQTNRIASVGKERVVHFYGEDMAKTRVAPIIATSSNSSTLQTSMSYVIAPAAIENLPFAGRDIYAAISLQPGVTSGTTTARGLSISANGQRPTASDFLVDGLRNNNALLTGPLVTVSPEEVQEYRVSITNYTAENGATAGYVANAITYQGGPLWHGVVFLDFNHNVLNANDYAQKAQGFDTPQKQVQPGLRVSGPIIRDRLFLSLSGEYLRFRSSETDKYRLPTADFVASLPSNSIAAGLLNRFAAPRMPANGPTAIPLQHPSSGSLDRWLVLPRIDYLFAGGKERLLVRELAARGVRPDYSWTPYRDFITPLSQSAASFGTALISSWPAVTNEARFGYTEDDLRFNRRWPEIPNLVVAGDTSLPGSPLAYSFRDQGSTLEFTDSVLLTTGRHMLKFGGDTLRRMTSGYLTAGHDPTVNFSSLGRFAVDSPNSFFAAVTRDSTRVLMTPTYDRDYRYWRLSAFGEDTFRWKPNLTAYVGIRYDRLGAPSNVGSVKDELVQLGPGSNFGERLSTATLNAAASGDQPLYDTDNSNWGVRTGFAYVPFRKLGAVLRGGYGIFYDHPFDNLWQGVRNNTFVIPLFMLSGTTNYLQPVATLLKPYAGTPYARLYPKLVLFEPELRNGYAQNLFLAIEQSVTPNFTFELNALGSLGRRLITTDIVNRERSTSSNYNGGRFNVNPNVEDISYRGSQGSSNYYGLAAVAHYRSSRAQYQVAYTFSHSIDNQSDPLASDEFDLQGTQIAPTTTRDIGAGFIRQFDSSSGRASSDFDQRHNLVGYSLWQLPAISRRSVATRFLNGWAIAALGAIRSGFPFTVTAPTGEASQYQPGAPYQGVLFNNPANIVNPGQVFTGGIPVAGGERLLNASAFAVPPVGQIGNSGRNAFRGPGRASLDFSLSREFSIPRWSERLRIVFRADAFNVLNHANLGLPDSYLASPTFGIAQFGAAQKGAPAVLPLTETSRQIHLMLRIRF